MNCPCVDRCQHGGSDINEIKSKIGTLPILYIVYPNSNHRTMVQHGVDIMSVNTNIKRDALVKFVNELLLLGRGNEVVGRKLTQPFIRTKNDIGSDGTLS